MQAGSLGALSLLAWVPYELYDPFWFTGSCHRSWTVCYAKVATRTYRIRYFYRREYHQHRENAHTDRPSSQGLPTSSPLPLLPLNDNSSLLNALRSSPIFEHATPSVVVTNDCRKRKIRPSWKVDGTGSPSWINYTKRASQATSSWK